MTLIETNLKLVSTGTKLYLKSIRVYRIRQKEKNHRTMWIMERVCLGDVRGVLVSNYDRNFFITYAQLACLCPPGASNTHFMEWAVAATQELRGLSLCSSLEGP